MTQVKLTKTEIVLIALTVITFSPIGSLIVLVLTGSNFAWILTGVGVLIAASGYEDDGYD